MSFVYIYCQFFVFDLQNPGYCPSIVIVSHKKIQMEIPFENLSAEKFRQKMELDPKAVILDVRTPAEVSEGHIPDALHIDINQADFDDRIAVLDRKKAYYIYCRSGKRSSFACLKMADAGFGKLYNLDGGILDWDGDLAGKA